MGKALIIVSIFTILIFSLAGFLAFQSWQGKKRSQKVQSSTPALKEIPEIQSLPFYYRTLDYLLAPAMWVLGKFKPPLMETHPWHMQNIHCDLVPDDIGEKVIGQDPSRYDFDDWGLFHMPLFGGWKNYLVLEAKDFKKYWRVGWKVLFFDKQKGQVCQVHKLKIYQPRIILLTGINDSEKIGFGVNDSNQLIPVKIVGKGVLGDGRFPGVRLF